MSARPLRLDMHVHTRLSFDCLSPPERILAAMDALGVDRVVVCDHNEIDAALELHAREPDRVLVGEEVKTREGFDVIGIFLKELIPKGTPARETCERIRAQGGIVYMPHPFDRARSGAGKRLDELAELVDVVEVHNARCWIRGFNQRAEKWAEARGVLKGAGSDAHTIREIGSGLVELPPFEHERESFLRALGAGRVSCTIRSSPLYRAVSTYAKLRKRIPIGNQG